jgi:hypothetical protein
MTKFRMRTEEICVFRKGSIKSNSSSSISTERAFDEEDLLDWSFDIYRKLGCS